MPLEGAVVDPFLGKHDRPITPWPERYRLALSASTTNDLFDVARQAGQLIITVVMFVFQDNSNKLVPDSLNKSLIHCQCAYHLL